MPGLVRPSFYGAYLQIRPVIKSRRRKLIVDVVGPICESSDFLARERELPDMQQGEYLSVFSAGAYGFTMSSDYNSRPRAAEVMVQGKKYSLVKKRETHADLLRGDSIPPFV